jgi:oxysterol-binding protein-related protein 9/10/11
VELDKTTWIVSSTGYLATIEYSGKGWVSGHKNSFTATLAKEKQVLYKIFGQWTGDSTFTSVNNPAQKDVPFWNAKSNAPTHVVVSPVDKQISWESRKIWKNVAEAIDKNDVETAGRYKSAIEIGQRKMREEEQRTGERWQQRFFKWVERDETASELAGKLASLTGSGNGAGVGSWKFEPDEEDRTAIESGKLFEGV